MLYGDNVFHFLALPRLACQGAIEHFLAFTHSTPEARLDCLRHLRLDIQLKFELKKRGRTYVLQGGQEYRWKRTCDTLKRMKNLSTLNVILNPVTYQTGTMHCNRRQPVVGQAPEIRVVKQLIGVRARYQCVVEVPWARSVVGHLPGAEFELREGEGALDDVLDESLLGRHGQ